MFAQLLREVVVCVIIIPVILPQLAILRLCLHLIPGGVLKFLQLKEEHKFTYNINVRDLRIIDVLLLIIPLLIKK